MFTESQIFEIGSIYAREVFAEINAEIDLTTARAEDLTPVTFHGQFAILSDGIGSEARLVVYLDSSVPGAGYGEWYGKNSEGEMISSEDLSEFIL